MAADRREFIRRTAIAAAALGTRAASPLSAQERVAAMPTPRAAALMAAFGLKYPIFNAGMGGLASPQLAAAVSNAGGLGATGVTNFAADVVRGVVSRIKAATDRPFAVNYLLAYDRSGLSTLSAALEAGAPVIQFAWGIPSNDAVSAIRTARAKFAVQVGSAAGAKRALDLGADYLICQGTEAGGHVQATTPLGEALPRVLEEAKNIPVLAGGGIANGQAIRQALVAGASGVLIGTRFLATKEASAHDEYKNALTRAKASDTVLTVCFQDGWVNAPHRVLRNRTFEMWEAAGCPPPGRRPGEGDAVATRPNGRQDLRYGLTAPVPGMTGTVTDLAMYAGRGVDAIKDVPGAGELVERLWKECLDAV
jgi:nitronate monooxygenase